MLTEKSVISQMTILEDGQILVQRADLILRDGVEIARTLHRHVVHPGQDLASEDVRVLEVCAFLHTPECIVAYQESQAKQA